MAHRARTAGAICVFGLLATANAASAGGAASDFRPHSYQILALGDDDDSLMVSESPFIMLPHLGGEKGTSLKLEIDPCGSLSSVNNTRSSYIRSGMADDFDDLDGDDDDPTDQGRFLMESWLSQQSEFRVINDGVARECGGDDWLDDDDTAELLASLGKSEAHIPRALPTITTSRLDPRIRTAAIA
jgi:hypothetical protein